MRSTIFIVFFLYSIYYCFDFFESRKIVSPLNENESPKMSNLSKKILEANKAKSVKKLDFPYVNVAPRNDDYEVFFHVFDQSVAASTVSLKNNIYVAKTLKINSPQPVKPKFSIQTKFL